MDVTCPRCDGSGEVGAPGYSVNPSTGMLGRDPQYDETGTCPVCHGDGTVPVDEVTVTLTRRQATALADLVANTYRLTNFSMKNESAPGNIVVYLSDDEMKDLHDRMEASRA